MGLKRGVLTVRNIGKATGTNKGANTEVVTDEFGLITPPSACRMPGTYPAFCLIDVEWDIEVSPTKRQPRLGMPFGDASCRLVTF